MLALWGRLFGKQSQALSFAPAQDPPPPGGVLALATTSDAAKSVNAGPELYPAKSVGGKGANLLVIRRCGASVPAFLILPVAECERALTRAEEKSGKSLRGFLASGAGAEELRAALLEDVLSEDVQAMIRSFVGGDKARAFAVRSSATVEDGTDSAFAGQFVTLLNVHTVEGVAAAVKKCWASLLGETVRSYYVKNNLTAVPLMAVVIMEQVDSRVSGVYFEANPVTGAASTHCISAAPGQGEGIVSGKVTTDEFWLNATDGAVKRRLVAVKSSRVGLAEVNDGIREEPVPAELQSAPSLTDAQLQRLFEAVKKLRQAFRSPQDVEWCFDKDDRLYLLQSRPITTHCESMEWKVPDVGLWRLNAHVSKPMSAIYSPIWCKGWSEGCLQNSILTGSGFVAVDTCDVNGFGYFCMRFPGPKKPPTAPPPKFLMRTILRLTGGKDSKRARDFWEGKAYLKFRDEFDTKLKADMVAKHRALQSEDLSGKSNEQLVDYLRRCHAHMEHAWYCHVTWSLQQMQPAAYFALKAREWSGCTVLEASACLEGCSPVSEGLHGEFPNEIKKLSESSLARGLLTRESGNEDEETLQAILALSPENGGDAARQIVGDIEYRLAEGYDPANMITKESPSLIVSALRCAIDHPPLKGPNEEAATALRARIPDANRTEFDALLQETRTVMHLRDERAIYTDLWAAGILHRAMVACGNKLGQPVLVLEGTLEEISQAMTSGALSDAVVAVWKQRQEVRNTRSIRDAPEFIGGVDVEITPEHFPNEWLARSFETIMIATRQISTPKDYESRYQDVEGGLKALKKCLLGLPGSRGVVEGVARVVKSSTDCARVQKGDVIITESPSSLINLILPFASAIVCDFGATLSHAAICAREAGIPCVIGVRNGTVMIKDGDRVRVDGTVGRVELL